MSDQERRSIAIAGAWGYIGQKFIEAGRVLGYDIHVFDPGPIPDSVDPAWVNRIEDEQAFYALDVDLFHLALHPEHRDSALDALLPRADSDPIYILNEKPMAAPESPEVCQTLVDRIEASNATVLFDFPELFDPITAQICAFLDGFDEYTLTEVRIQRSKDREDPDNPRNYKRMVPIQFQESVHCLAFLLNLVSRRSGSLMDALSSGITVQASSSPYEAPNPGDYPYVVDGRCDYDARIGEVKVVGHTDFKRKASFRKERIIRGVGDGEPFEIQVDYLEGAKYLMINGEDQRCPPWGSSYTAVLNGFWSYVQGVQRGDLMSGVYPNPTFAWHTYQLSSLVWRASYDGEEKRVDDARSLLDFDAGYASEMSRFPRYGK